MADSGGLRLRLFGIFDATLDGEPLANLRLRSAAQLLALLCCRHGRACQDTWLAQMLWPDTESLDSLRSSIVALRRALGPEAWRVETGNTTVRLRIEGADIDVAAFDDLIEKADIASLRTAISLNPAGCLRAGTTAGSNRSANAAVRRTSRRSEPSAITQWTRARSRRRRDATAVWCARGQWKNTPGRD